MATFAALSTHPSSPAELLSFSSSPSLSSTFTWKKKNAASFVHSSSYRLANVTAKLTSESNSGDNVHSHGHEPLMDRRELMAASVAGFSLLTPQLANADPVAPPDLNKCGLAIVNPPSGSTGVSPANLLCCLPGSKVDPVDYVLEKRPPKKVRMAAHRVDEDYIRKYNKAYQMMRDLPPTDPRSLKQQADIHCAFCNQAYVQTGNTAKLQVHFSWLFLPWHRWYLYFHERILGSLIGDPHFSLVYWNWDDQQDGGNQFPQMFLQGNAALYDSKRNQSHLPPTIINLTPGSKITDPDQVIKENLNQMYQTVVKSKKPRQFMGDAYRAGDTASSSSAGSLESAPHTAGHAWTGDPRETYRENMGNFYSAGRDPVFYSHHANVDRVWSVWKSIGGHSHTNPDFLNAHFVFYDEKSKLVRVNVHDVLQDKKLGVFYEPSPTDKLWLDYTPELLAPAAAIDTRKIPEIGPAVRNKTRTDIGKKFTSKAVRPELPKVLKNPEEVDEVLVLEGVQIPINDLVQLVVFINLPDADENTPTTGPEYVGSFTNIPHAGMDMERITSLRFSISDNIDRLGITDISDLVVTVVKRGEGIDVPITVQGIKIEYDDD